MCFISNLQHWLTCSACSNINTNLNHLKMLIFRWYYKQLCISMKIFNMFDNQNELQSFQSRVRRGDARHLSQHGSNIEKAFKINRKVNICKWIRVTRNQKNRPTFPQGGAERSTSGVWNDKPQTSWKCWYFIGLHAFLHTATWATCGMLVKPTEY